MSSTCYHEGCIKLFEAQCLEADHLRAQADTTKDPRITPQFTRAGLARVIDNFRSEMGTNCGTGDVALMLAIEYATGVMNQIPE